jgi:redox-sensitive bicupin YhaK (pirin superfamily)
MSPSEPELIRPEIIEPRSTEVGGIPVQRVLPRAGRRTIGAWCFVDQAGPVNADTTSIQVGPHPHIGLHTVSWMIAGELVHHDSLGNEQVLRPGEVNLMTAGHGIAHAEVAAAHTRGSQQLVQLWVAQPETTRHGPPHFAHHRDLPSSRIDGSEITVLLGESIGLVSPVHTDTPILGAQILLTAPLQIPVSKDFEHGVMPIDNDIYVNGHKVRAGSLGYLPTGTTHIELSSATGSARVMVIGGEPFPETLRMHWNFVARSSEELHTAVEDWNAANPRFGRSHWAERSGLERISSPPLR